MKTAKLVLIFCSVNGIFSSVLRRTDFGVGGFGVVQTPAGIVSAGRANVLQIQSTTNADRVRQRRSPFSDAKTSGMAPSAGGAGLGNTGTNSGSPRDGSGPSMGPFASSLATGNGGGKSPFTTTNDGSGANLFSGAVKGQGPFNAKMEGSNGMLGGLDFSSLLSSGPGGLSGGDFMASNSSMLMGHDYSQDLGTGAGSGGQFGDIGKGNNQLGVDNSRFDTTAYQNMLKDLFSTGNTDQNLGELGTPFDGTAYNYDTSGSGSYNTAKEASVGSFASTDMSAYAQNRGAANTGAGSLGENKQTESLGVQSGNPGYGGYAYNGNENSGSGVGSGDYGNGNPFNVNNYDFSSNKASSSSGSGMTTGESLFDATKFSNGKSPFTLSTGGNIAPSGGTFNMAGNSMDSGSSGKGPFDTSKFGMLSGDKQSGTGGGQNPFDTSKYQATGALNNMFGNQQYQNIGSGIGSGSINGLDVYGNVDFGSLSGLSGNSVDAGSAGGLGIPSYTGSSSYNGQAQGSGAYSGFSDSSGTGQYGVNNGISYTSYSNSGSGYTDTSNSQYKTPFEADNYNELLGNPFKSDSYFDTTKQNFKLPYENRDNFDASYMSSPGGYSASGSSYSAIGSGPGGNPFQQGGNSMSPSHVMRGR